MEIVGFEHLHCHSDFSLLDGFGQVEEYSARWKGYGGNYLCISDHGMLAVIPRQIKTCEPSRKKDDPNKDKRLQPIFACFPTGQPIITKRGIKDIQDIVENDIVLTHKGRWQPVIKTMQRSFSGKLYSIWLSGSKKKCVKITGEHPILIRDSDGKLNWKKVSEVVAGYRTTDRSIGNYNSYVAFPKTPDFRTWETINIKDSLPNEEFVVEEGCIKKAKKKNKFDSLKVWRFVKENINLNEDLAYVLGLYCAEGSLSISKGKLTGGFRFSLNSDEHEFRDRLISYFSETFGLNPSLSVYTDTKQMDVCFGCLPLAYLLKDVCGKGAANKKVPVHILNAPISIKQAFVNGLLDGDGKNPFRESNHSKQATLKVCSKTLAWQFKQLLAELGIWSSVSSLVSKKSGKTHYYVPYSPCRAYDRFIEDDNYVYKPIREIACEDVKDLQVFNFEVAVDNSYVTDFTVHNCELYVNPMQIEYATNDELQAYIKSLDPPNLAIMRKRGFHLLAIAYNDIGYSNLVKLSSIAWTKGFYYRPRCNHEQLKKYKEGIIFTSCCYASEVGQAFDRGGEEAGFEMIEKYIEMFGRENYYLEIMLLDFVKQKPYNKFIIKAHEKYGLRIILTNDTHYCNPEDSKFQRYMLMIQTGNTVKEIQRKLTEEGLQDMFELQDTNLWLKTEEELNAKWASDFQSGPFAIDYEIFKQAKMNTVEICKRAAGVRLDRSMKLPQIENADQKLKDYVYEGFKKRHLPSKGREGLKYIERIKEEYSLICHKDFSSYFLIQKEMTDEARRICREIYSWSSGKEAVGPGRGCLYSGTGIVMADGNAKPICEVMVGDRVVTRDGTCHEVEKVWQYPIKEDLIGIYSYYGDNEGVGLTVDHKVLVEKGKRPDRWNSWADSTKKSRQAWQKPTGDLHWLRADQIEIGDSVFTPTPKLPHVPYEKIDLASFCNEDNLLCDEALAYQDVFNPLTGKLKKRKSVQRHISLDADWYTLIGIFAGDGWLRSDGSGRVGFCFAEEEVHGKLLLFNKMDEIGADYYVVPKYKNKRVTQVIINNRYLERLFRSWFSNYQCTSQTKHVPDFVFYQNDDLKRAFLRGYHLSDGHEGDVNKFTTTSRRLANGIRFIHWQVGEPASLAAKLRIDPRSGVASTERSVKSPRTLGVSLSPDRLEYVFHQVEGGFLTKVRKIAKISNVEKVFDLQVKDNHDYLTTSFHVHNSAAGSLITFCLGITDVDPLRHDLLFSRFLSETRGGKSIKLFFDIDPISVGEAA